MRYICIITCFLQEMKFQEVLQITRSHSSRWQRQRQNRCDSTVTTKLYTQQGPQPIKECWRIKAGHAGVQRVGVVRLRILGETSVKVCVGMNQMKKGCQGRKYMQGKTQGLNILKFGKYLWLEHRIYMQSKFRKVRRQCLVVKAFSKPYSLCAPSLLFTV